MKALFTTVVCILWWSFLSAQTDADTTEQYQNFWQYGKEVGLNVSPLVRKFVPFNLSPTNPIDNLLALKTKWYGEKRAVIINFGIDIGDNNEANSLFLSLGYERRRNISERWKYTTGWEVTLITLNPTINSDAPSIGISKPYGIEYHFQDNFYIATEARFFVGALDGINFKLLVPNSVYFGMLLE